MVGGANVADKILDFDARLIHIDAHPAAVKVHEILMAGSGDDMQLRIQIRKPGPNFPQEKFDSNQIRQMGEGSDEQQTVRRWFLTAWLKAIQVHTVLNRYGFGKANCLAVLFRHGNYGIHFPPCGCFKIHPHAVLQTGLPIFVTLQQLGVKVQSDVVLHKNSFGWFAIGCVLGQLSELKLYNTRFPFPNGLA